VISHLDADGDDVDPDSDDTERKKKLTPSQRRRDLAELDSCISTLGGRLTDLEFLARRIKAGESPNKAVREIVEQSASEILKMYLYGTEDRKWSPQQAWLLIKQLAASDSATLRYNEVLLSDTYKPGGDDVLQALEQAEMISIASFNGRPMSIKPGKPVYEAAFRRLTEDNVLRSKFDLAILTDLVKIESTSIEKAENELKLLGELPRQPQEVAIRVKYLLGKIAGSQTKVEAYEKLQGELKKVLQEEF
jgi:RNA12 protein